MIKNKYLISIITVVLLTMVLEYSCLNSGEKDEPTTIHSTDNYSADDITLALSKLVIETKASEIPDEVFKEAKIALLDALGCSFAGHDAAGVPDIIDLAKYWGGREEATIWFDGTRVPITEATFVNSVQVHALDLDDNHPSDTHVTSVLLPTVLAVGESTNANGEEILTALILGTEVIGRLSRAYIARRINIGFLPTSIIGGFGATAAACRLMNCSVEETVNAMGIWYAHASGNRQALFDRTLTKRIQPGIAARAGVFASCLARKGITGPTRIIGGQLASLLPIYGGNPNLKPPEIDEIMVQHDTWQIEQLVYKSYACCGYSDRPIKVAIDLSTKYDLKPEEIKEIRLFGDRMKSPFAGVPWEESPTPQVLAQFCVPYATASAIKNRKYGPAEISPQRIRQDEDVDSLARRTKICDWSEWTGSPPEDTKNFAMEIDLVDGRKLVQTFSGSPRYEWPEDYDDIISKFISNITYSGMLDESKANELVTDIENLEKWENIKDFIQEWLVY